MSTPTPYKPSPLSFNSPRQSPFRRPGSIRESSPSIARPSTPTTSPLKPKDTPTASSQANLRRTTTDGATQNPPAWLSTRGASAAPETPVSPTRNIASPTRPASTSTQHTMRPFNTSSVASRFEHGKDDTPFPLSIQKTTPTEKTISMERSTPLLRPVERTTARSMPLAGSGAGDALSKLPPQLLHSMRESFSVMDRDNDGHVNSVDVSDMLSQLGLSATPAQLSAYFSGAQSINLATYLTTLSELLGGISQAGELSAAFEAFDDGDDGQIDLAELKDALLHTAPEPGENKLTEQEIDMVMEGFSRRRAFGKGGKSLGRGDVFRYQEFMSSLTGGSNGTDTGAAPA